MAIVDAGTFLISAARARRSCARPTSRAPGAAACSTSELVAGFRHFFTTPVLRAILPAVVFGAGGVGLAEVIPFAVVHDGLHRGGAFLGVLGAFHGAGRDRGRPGRGPGSSIGSARCARSPSRSTLGAGGMASYAFATIPSALLASLLFGCCLAGVIVSWTTLIQRRTPSELLGRAAAAGEALASIPYVGAIALGSALVTMVDFRLLSAGRGRRVRRSRAST